MISTLHAWKNSGLAFLAVIALTAACGEERGDWPSDAVSSDAITGSEGEEGSEFCSNTCDYADDGFCDDCGPGSEFSLCDLGTDCADCGPRSGSDTCAGGGSGSGAEGDLCSNACEYANDGVCDDCGSGSEFSVCDLGTDCADCGARSASDTCSGGGGSSSGGSGGGSSHVGPCHFSCQYCSGTTECTGTGCGTCQSLCQEACYDGGCGAVLSCY